MAAITYCPGPWLGLVRGGTIVLLEQSTREDVVMAVWEVLGAQPAPESVLGAVVSGYGMDLASIPQFAIVSFQDKLHAILRGDVVLNSDGVGTSAELSGEGVTTWTERLLPAQELFDLVINDGRDGEGRWLPLAEGIVQLGGIRVGVDTAARPADPAAGQAESAEPAVPMSRHEELNVPEGIEVTGIYDPDDLDEAEDFEDTVIHTKAQRANLPPSAAVPPAENNVTAGPAPSLAAPPQQSGPARQVGPVQQSAPARQSAPASLIDSVPWLTPSASARARAAESATAEAAQDLRAVNQVDRTAEAAEAAEAPEGDHDGQTLLRRDLPLAPKTAPAPVPDPAQRPATGAMVLARVCPQGHANPPTSSNCSICAAGLADDASQVQRPSLGRMRLSTGEVIELDRPVIVGRQPSASRVQGNGMPRLVQVRSVSGDISRSHLEVRLEGWHVMLCDLKATNGTMLIRGGQPPRRLGQGESTILLDGDIADLGDGISLRFEDLP
ncbi:FHA domain-containing protein [Crystallibacter degradans]|uniref:FHA domain-containing protein n=1 Tax=Crystallibacter degradans TaxID=2726743 RepID=UPI001473A53B|nr:FHA domain-containing protein [Arthrobacter sp. SF27]NMR30335.1 FHA domain-containing protein [Arthrobacter sp. SF27]